MPAAESRVISRNVRPPGTNRSAWRGRSAPPDSTSATTGSRLRSAISRRAQLLGHPDRRDRAALHRRLVGDDHALDAADRPDPDDEPGARGRQVGLVRAGERADLEERGVRVEQQVDALARGQPAALVVAVDVLRAAGGEHRRGDLVDAREGGQHRLAVRRELRRRRVEARAQDGAGRDPRERSCPHRILPRRPGERLADLHPLPRGVAGDHEAGVVDVHGDGSARGRTPRRRPRSHSSAWRSDLGRPAAPSPLTRPTRHTSPDGPVSSTRTGRRGDLEPPHPVPLRPRADGDVGDVAQAVGAAGGGSPGRRRRRCRAPRSP